MTRDAEQNKAECKRRYWKNRDDRLQENAEYFQAHKFELLRKQQLRWLNNGRTKKPQAKTLEKYGIVYNEETLMWE